MLAAYEYSVLYHFPLQNGHLSSQMSKSLRHLNIPHLLDKGRQQVCWPHTHLLRYLKGNASKGAQFSFDQALLPRSWHYQVVGPITCSPLGLTHTPPCLASVPFTSIPSRMPSSTPRDWGGHNGPPGTPTGHPPTATQALGHSTHGTRLSTWPFTPCPAPQGGRVVGGAREWQVGELGGKQGLWGIPG